MTMWIPDISARTGPRYQAIVDVLEEDIQHGRLLPGDRLPTHRSLALALGVSVGTTTHAYEEAEKRGLVTGEIGRGTFVRKINLDVPKYEIPASPETGLIDLSLNYPVGFSDEEESLILANTLIGLSKQKHLHELLRYQPHVGMAHHRTIGSQWIARTGVETNPEQVVICNGMQHALAVIMAAVTRPGDCVMTAEITYPGIKIIAQSRDLHLHGLRMDDNGIVPADFEEACKSTGAKILYCIPSIQNPAAITMPEKRRKELAEIAVRHDVTIIEDDTYGLMIERPLKPIAFYGGENCIYIAGTSESIVPGLRIAFVRSPSKMVDSLSGAMLTTTWMAAPLMAELATAWITNGQADLFIQRKRQEIEKRHKIFDKHLGHLKHRKHPCGFHLWMYLPERWRSVDYVHLAYRRGVAVTPADLFYVGEDSAPSAVRLCLGNTRDLRRMERGLQILAELADGTSEHSIALL